MTPDEQHSDQLGSAIRLAVADVHAPAALRARIEADHSARRAPRRARFPALGLAGAAAVALCASAIVLVIGLLGGGERRFEGPTLALAADAALRSAVGPAPVEDAAHPVLVSAGINGLRFPYWDDEFGFDAVGVTRGQVGGRRAMTVDYRGHGRRVGYTIVAGPALTVPDGAPRVHRGTLRLAVLRRDGATIVTWRRAGHTCVLASRDADARRLLDLAAWTGGGRVGGYGR